MSFVVEAGGNRGATRASVVQAGELEDLGDGLARFAAAQWPTKKDEDKVHVSGPIPGLCDAVVQLYDGHGGKHAAVECVAKMSKTIEEAFFKLSPANERFRNNRAALAYEVGEDGFHKDLDKTLDIKRDDPSGTTAAGTSTQHNMFKPAIIQAV